MSKAEHLKIYSGKKLILEGDFWIPRIGKCRNCDVIGKLVDDVYCELCQEKLRLKNIRDLPIAKGDKQYEQDLERI